MLVISLFLTLQHAVMYLRNHGVGIYNPVMNLRNDGAGFRNIVTTAGNDSMCTSRQWRW